MTVIARQNTKRLCNRTHSWTVHSGIVFGIWPLLSRLQSTSSPEHAQGGGHVPAWAPHPRCSLRESRKITANPANPRGCGEDRILNLSREREREHPSSVGSSRWSATNSTEREEKSPHTHTHTHTKKNPKSVASDRRSRCLYPIRGCREGRGGERWQKSALLELAHSCGETFCAVSVSAAAAAVGANLCCSGSPQRSVSTQQRYAGGEEGPQGGCLGNVVRAAAPELSAFGAVSAA